MIEVVSYRSVGSIPFGAAEQELIDALGPPTRVVERQRGTRSLYYGELRFGLHEGEMFEASATPSIDIALADISIFGSADAFNRLLDLDGAPMHTVGYVVLLQLGLALTGFHDGNLSQKAVTAFARGSWDTLRPKMKPYSR